jgi:acyl-[acyl carrier protein]--UDP-N-acetylglucosamine O-acyltransferase
LRRAGFTSNAIQAIKKITTLFYQHKISLDALQAHVAADAALSSEPSVQDFISFVKNSQRGVTRKSEINSTVSF